MNITAECFLKENAKPMLHFVPCVNTCEKTQRLDMHRISSQERLSFL